MGLRAVLEALALSPDEEPWPNALIYKDGKPTWRYRVEPFQVAVARSGLAHEEIARRLGWGRKDGTRVARVLGLRSWPTGKVSSITGEKYEPRFMRSLSYENAAALARVLELDFTEWEI